MIEHHEDPKELYVESVVVRRGKTRVILSDGSELAGLGSVEIEEITSDSQRLPMVRVFAFLGGRP